MRWRPERPLRFFGPLSLRRRTAALLALAAVAAGPAFGAGERSDVVPPWRGSAPAAAPEPAADATAPLPPELFGSGSHLAARLRDDGQLLFDGVRFDPLRDDEPDVARFVPEAPAYGDLAPDAARHAVVQLHRPPGPAERAELAAAGLELLAYVPRHAYLVRGSALALAAAADLPAVRWVGRYRPGYKLDRKLGRLAAGLVPAAPLPGEQVRSIELDLLVTPGADPAELGRQLAAAVSGLEVLSAATGEKGPGLLAVRIDADRLDVDLAAIANAEPVLAVEPAARPRLLNDDAVWIGQSYDVFARRDYAQSATIWNQGLLGEGEIIGISDSGVDPDTCWFEDPAGLPTVSSVPATGQDRAPMPVDASRRKIIGYNLLGTFQQNAEPYDVRSGDPHGTWAAVSAVGDNPDRVPDENDPLAPHHDAADGMAPLAKLVVQDLADENGRSFGLGDPQWKALDGMFWQMHEAGARIATNSWGAPGNQYDVVAFFADLAAHSHPDLLVVFSAGNDGPYDRTVYSPGTAKNVLTVGASDAKLSLSDDLDPDNVASFSSRGPTEDGRLKPDILMSGHRLITGDSDFGETGRTCDTREVNGTSFATPIVAGFSALVREYYRKGYYPSGTRQPDEGFLPSAALLKASLVAGARSMTGRAGADHRPCVLDTCDVSVRLCNISFIECDEDADCRYCDGDPSLRCDDDRDCDLSRIADDAPHPQQGWGRLHLDDVLYFAGDTRGLAAWDVPRETGVTTGETWRGQVYVEPGSDDLQVVLAWTDPPALTASPSYLVNDLDLKLVAPDGTVYWGNAWEPRDREPLTREFTASGVRPTDDPDNVEMVRIASWQVQAGTWDVEVVGESVPGSPWVDDSARQGFAVVGVGPVVSGGGVVRFTRPVVGCSGDVGIEVLDAGASGSVTVVVTTASGDEETVVLPETGNGRFAGTIPAAGATELVAGNGRLELADGEQLRAAYDDPDPVHTSAATAAATCGSTLLAGPATITGGCDGDGFLDAGEEVELTVSLSNPGRVDVEGVSARLLSDRADIFVRQDAAGFGDVPAGGQASSTTPFILSLRDGAAPRSEARLVLEVSAASWTTPRRFPLDLLVETDEIHTDGVWTEDFSGVVAECWDGSADPTPGAWYWLDPDNDCATSEDTWEIGLCYGEQQALLPSCTQNLISSGSETHHRLASPKIETGPAGSTTIVEQIRFLESYHFKINEDGQQCDWAQVDVYTNRDGRLLASGYFRDISRDGTDEIAAVDPTTLAEWNFPPVPDATALQVIFHVAWRAPLDGGFCLGSSGDELRWRVDDVEIHYQNIQRVDDATPTCAPGCAAPPAPEGVTVARLDGARAVVGWDAVDGAHHYAVYRSDGADEILVARVAAPEISLVDEPGVDGSFSWSVEAVDPSGLCPSARSASATPATPLDCNAPPPAVTGLEARDDAASTCSATLSWDPVTLPCGGAPAYRIYRSLDPGFEPGPETLLAEVATESFVDGSLSSGWDDEGEPRGRQWIYEVRAADPARNREGAGVRASVRPGGPRQSGTWRDDGGDERPAKMTSRTLLDELDGDAGWSRSAVAIHHGGQWSYWSDTDPLGDGRYEPLSCITLESPPIQLDPAGAPELSLFANYELEYTWDGLVVELAAGDGPFAPIDPIGGYTGSFESTQPPPCQGAGGGTGDWINGCDYPPDQGCLTGPQYGGLSGWEEPVFDLSAWAGETVRFRVNLSSDCGTNGGAVLDDLSVSGALLPTACATGACLPAPSFTGLIAARDLDPGATTGVELTWGEIADWGGGGPGQIEIYRDGERVATLGAAERSWIDAGAEPNRVHTWQVLARSGSGCELPSPSSARLEATDCGDLDAAAVEAARLHVERSPSGETLLLRAEPLAGAARYRFPWSHSPADVAGSPQALSSATPEARHAVAADGLDYFYLVEDERPDSCP